MSYNHCRWGHSYQLYQLGQPPSRRPIDPGARRSWSTGDFPGKGRVPCTLYCSRSYGSDSVRSQLWNSMRSKSRIAGRSVDYVNNVDELKLLGVLFGRWLQLSTTVLDVLTVRPGRAVRTSWLCCSYMYVLQLQSCKFLRSQPSWKCTQAIVRQAKYDVVLCTMIVLQSCSEPLALKPNVYHEWT